MTTSMGRVVLTRLAAVVYSLAVLIMGVRAIPLTDIGAWLFALLLVGWSASPIWAGLWIAERIPGKMAFSGCFLVMAAIAVIGFAEQWHVLFVGPVDALNALAMVFIPLYQWLATGLVLAVAWLTGRHVLKS